jgi:ketosteroid isomerase-like protein
MLIRNLTLMLLLFVACSTCIADEAADQRTIESNAQQWVGAFHAESATALASLTTTDVLVLNGDGHPVQGALGASQTWIRVAALTGGTLVSTTKEIIVSGDAAWRVALLSYQKSGGEQHQGQALEIWKRTNGGWKLHRQMSSNIIEAALRSVPSEPVLDRPTH